MSALLARLHAAGIRVKADGEDLVVRPQAPLTEDQLAYLRRHKPQLIAELRRADEVRSRLLAHLAVDPELVRAFEVVDPDSDPVRVAVAIRGVGSCELLIRQERWDPVEFLRLIHEQRAVS